MKTYAERIEEANEQHAQKIAELQREAEITAQLPPGAPVPYMVHFASRPCPWLSYKTKTLAEALDIARTFPAPLNVSARERGCVSVAPIGHHSPEYFSDKAKERWAVPGAIEVRQHGGRGFYTATLSFWCVVACGRDRVKVDIDIEQFPWQLRSRMNARYDSYGNVEQAQFIEGRIPAETKPAARIKFGGGSRDSFDIRHYFGGIDHAAKLAEVK